MIAVVTGIDKFEWVYKLIVKESGENIYKGDIEDRVETEFKGSVKIIFEKCRVRGFRGKYTGSDTAYGVKFGEYVG